MFFLKENISKSSDLMKLGQYLAQGNLLDFISLPILQTADTRNPKRFIKTLIEYSKNVEIQCNNVIAEKLKEQPSTNNLRYIDLRFSSINQDQIQPLCDVLKSSVTVEDLDLGGNRSISEPGVKAISKLLAQNSVKNLKKLGLYSIFFIFILLK